MVKKYYSWSEWPINNISDFDSYFIYFVLWFMIFDKKNFFDRLKIAFQLMAQRHYFSHKSQKKKKQYTITMTYIIKLIIMEFIFIYTVVIYGIMYLVNTRFRAIEWFIFFLRNSLIFDNYSRKFLKHVCK